MTGEQDGDAGYAMGFSHHERERLMEQAAVVGPSTKQFLLDAGLAPGMRLLDVGCGVGDVALLAASLLGAEGMIVGVDADPHALETASRRINEAGLTEVDFLQGDLHALSLAEPFDMAVGRFVLIHLGDPAAALQAVARQVRPGGIVAFQEYDFSNMPPSYPALPLWERSGRLLLETFRRAGVEMQMGLKLSATFQAAGLPAPQLRMDVAIHTGREMAIYRLMADTLGSVLPLAERFGLASAADVDITTLAERLRDEAVSHGGVVTWAPYVGGWTRKPLA